MGNLNCCSSVWLLWTLLLETSGCRCPSMKRNSCRSFLGQSAHVHWLWSDIWDWEFCSDCRRGNVLDTPRTSPSVLKRQTRQGRFWPRNRVNPAADTEEEGPLEVSPDGRAEEGAPYLPKVDAGGKESFPTEDLIADLPPATEEEEAPKVSEVNAGRKENDPFFIKIHFPCQNIRMEEDLCVENLED
ncbi:uncharacterized protein LOC144289404 isoform X1 [Canis aureus]